MTTIQEPAPALVAYINKKFREYWRGEPRDSADRAPEAILKARYEKVFDGLLTVIGDDLTNLENHNTK